MKYAIAIILVAVTAGLMVVGLFVTAQAGGTIGIAKGSALHTAKASTPDQALNNLLADVQRRNWDRAFANVVSTGLKTSAIFTWCARVTSGRRCGRKWRYRAFRRK